MHRLSASHVGYCTGSLFLLSNRSAASRAGLGPTAEVVVPPPACLYVLKRDDTHGTSYEVGVYDTMQEAQSKLDPLYFNEHHQHYYISKLLLEEPQK